jgi:23S rRNA pseudouridine2605 synthase
VMSLLGGIHEYIYPVGRLDFDSEGLLLLTNDGELAAQLTHPRHGVARVYEVTVAGVPDGHDIERLARGVTIEGRRTGRADVRLVPGRHEGRATLRITIAEGRNRQVRRMFDAVGHPVDQLRRVAIGPLRDTRLKSGHWRELTEEEVRSLKKAVARTVAHPGTVANPGGRASAPPRPGRTKRPPRVS